TVNRLDPNPVIDALNFLQYDAATPGNHDFDFGLDLFGRAVEAAAFPYVSANVYRLPRDTFALQRAVTIRRSEVSVGITGFTTPGVMVWDRAQLGDRIRVRRIVPEAGAALEALRGADLSVVLIHSGLDGLSSYDTTGVGPENVAADLARLPVKPDLVVVGHSHRQIRDTVIAGVHFVQPLPWARSLAVAHVWLARATGSGKGETGNVQPAWRVVRIRGDQVPLADVPPDPGLTRRLQAVHQQVRMWAGAPIAHTDDTWSARYARAEDTPVIDLVNEVQRRTAGSQLSATAAFNPQAGFGPGPVRLRDVAALYPYENTLKAVRIEGATLVRYLEQSAEYFRTFTAAGPVINDGIPGYNYDIVSGVSYAIDLTRPIGSRIIQVTYQGRLVQPADTFTLALNNYRQGGGGGFEMLQGLPVVYDRGENIRDLLVEAVRAARTLRVADYFTDSWRIIPPEARERLRRAFDSAR
ncbi:MAG: 5'-nucleotidase C-terminal domain-containing protein, partial [Gemmatimonadetes bacterium]|nr:5'-nucleotidase C-terminal domain-containing protein [Gemmatimonadota bacterium]